MGTINEFDAAKFLTTPESISEYLSAALDSENPELFLLALGDVARSSGISGIAAASGLGRESLYKSVTPGKKPRFETVMRILGTLGVQLTTKARTLE
jgi:probable addiction module antidote protein